MSEVDRARNTLEMKSSLIVLRSKEEVVKGGIEWSIILVFVGSKLVTSNELEQEFRVGKIFKLRFRTRSVLEGVHRSRRPGLCFVRIHFLTRNPISMLIHNVGDFGVLIVSIQAVPSLKWHLLLRCSTDHSVSTLLPRVTHQALY